MSSPLTCRNCGRAIESGEESYFVRWACSEDAVRYCEPCVLGMLEGRDPRDEPLYIDGLLVEEWRRELGV